MPKMSELTIDGVFTKSMMGGFRAGNPAELIRK
jgi:adenylylsulfate reductase subunit B